MQWPKMSIHKTIFVYQVIISLVTVVSLGFLWMMSERSRILQEERVLRAAYIEERKELLKREVDRAVGFVRYMQSLTEKRLKENVKNRVYEAHAIADNLYRQHKKSKSKEEIIKIVKDALRPIRFNNNRGYYFAFDMNGVETLFPVKPEMEGKNMLEIRGGKGEQVVADMLFLIKEKGESFYSYDWSKPGKAGFYPKIAFVKGFEPFGWGIGTGEYVDDVEKDIQEECLTWISNITFSKDGYVFAGRYDGMSLSGPQTGKNMFDVQDVNGVRIVQELIKAARKGGGFVHYVVPKFQGIKQAPKLSYAVGLNEWEWYIGAGVYVDEIDQEIAGRAADLNRRIKQTVLTISFILFSLFVLMFFLARFLSARIQKNLKLFTHFFDSASTDSIKINEEALHFTEFIQLARSANHMIEERIRAEHALSTSHERFLTVLDSIDATIYVADMQTCEVLFMNKYMRDAFGGDMTGATCWKAFRNQTGPCKNCTNDRLVDENGQPRDVYIWQDKNPVNGKWYINYDRAVEWIDGRLVRLQIATDISHLKKMEEDLLQARKMEAVGNLAGGVAHEFNNVLSIIIGNVELILYDVKEDDPLHRNVKEILAASLRARDVVRQLLNFSRKSGTEKKPTDIHRVVKEALKLLKASIPSDIQIRENLSPDVDGIMADSTQLHQLLINLCNNACQAMTGKGGVLTIDLDNVVVDESMASSLPGIEPGPHVRISVGDTGAGIPADFIDRIFDPYFTTKAVGKGTGMGLAVVHGIVKDHLGAVRVDSAEGEGTCFHVYFPSTREKSVQETEKKFGDHKGRERMIFVDYEPSIAQL